MAHCINAPANSPKMDFDFVTIQGISRGGASSGDGQDILIEHARLPSIAVLQTVDSIAMLRCREYGDRFFTAYRKWQSDQTSQNAGLMVEQLRSYCERICFEFSQNTESKDYLIYASTSERRQDQIGQHAIGIGSSTTVGTVAGSALEAIGIEGATAAGAATGAVLGQMKTIFITNQLENFRFERNLRKQSSVRLSTRGDLTVSQK